MMRTLSCLLAVCVAAAACSDEPTPPLTSTPDAAPPTAPDAAVEPGARPTLTFAFPPRPVMTRSSTLIVRGTAATSDGSTITGVTVAGAVATSTDGFATWQAEVTLTAGDNALVAEATTSLAGIGIQVAPTVYYSDTTLVTPVDVALDDANQRALVVDDDRDAVIAIDLVTGVHRVVSDDSTGAGPAFDTPIRIAFDPASQRAYVVDNALAALIAVDVTTGDRTVISDATTGSGPTMASPTVVTLDLPLDRALMIDGQLDAVVAVDLTTGARVILSDATVGSGPLLQDARDMVIDPTDATLLVTDFAQRAIFRIDPLSGQRRILSTGNGTGDGYHRPVSITVDNEPFRATVTDGSYGAVVRVNLQEGDDQDILASDVYDFDTWEGDGIILGNPKGMVFDPANDRYLLVDDERDQLVAVSPDGHVSTPWADAGRQAAIEPTTVFVDPATSKAWTVDRLNLGVIEIDLATGEQTVLSRDRQSGSTRLFHGRDVVLDAAAGRLIVSSAATSDGDWRSALISVSLADGARSGLGGGTGRSFAFLPSVDLDPAQGQVWFINRNESPKDCDFKILAALDLASLNRTDVSGVFECDVDIGAGPAFGRPTGVVLDLAQNRAILPDLTADAVFAVDLTTGARSIIADAATGAGPAFEGLLSVEPDTAPDRLLLLDAVARTVLRFDPATGDREVVVDNATGSGVPLTAPTHAAADVFEHIVLIADPGAGGIIMADLQTGARALLWY